VIRCDQLEDARHNINWKFLAHLLCKIAIYKITVNKITISTFHRAVMIFAENFILNLNFTFYFALKYNKII